MQHDFEQRLLARHTDPQREAMEAGAPMHVETIATVAEAAVIGS